MNCKHCNMPIKEEEHFCSNCEKSTEVLDATRKYQTNFKLKRVAVLVGLAVVIVIGVISTVKVRSGINKSSIEIQLSLGEKYLEELECDKAIFVFNEAIQMKPRNVRAYLGLAQAYEGIGELENATDVVEKGVQSLAKDMKKQELEGVASLYLKLIGLYEKLGVHDKSAQAVKEGYELTKNSELRRLNNRYFPTVDISLAPGEYDKKQQISLTTKGAKIYYTTDGSEPNKYSKIYTEEITILADTLLKGVVENEYGLLGDISTWEYQIKFEDSVIKWKDEALELYVKEFLGKSIDEPVYVSEVSGLGEVIISGTRMVEEFFNLGGEIRTTGEIKSLQDLVHFKSLTSLCVEYNNVSDLSSLSELKYLNELFLDNNNISDLSPLSGLNNLTYVYLNNNNISDLSPLSKLTNLTTLELHNNNISDLSPLSELVNLDGLGIENSNISDVSPLSKLVKMTELHLNNNKISDLSPLSELVNLNYIYLSNNNISDLGPLSKLENLYMLVIDNNTISDLTPLSELENT
ncbi:MAG: internalin [Clostridiales bacterium]|nr:internalin [Clostridiales bacterium]